jgi:hypothetical protein
VTLSIVDFLNARLAEDEAAAQQAKATGGPMSPWWGAEQLKPLMVDADATHVEHHSPERVLREVVAKRAVMERHCPSQSDGCVGCGVYLGRDDQWHPNVQFEDCEELLGLAAVYSDHPDYNPEWSTT